MIKILKVLAWSLLALAVIFIFCVYTHTFIRFGDGPSMEPTFTSGNIVLSTGLVSPKAGDIVSLTHTLDNVNIDKRLIKVDKNNCWWVEGDNKAVSYDSRNYGWICPKDRSYEGVVIWYKNLN